MQKPQTDQEFFELLNRWWDAGLMARLNLPAHLHARFDIPKPECIRTIGGDGGSVNEQLLILLQTPNIIRNSKL